MAKSILSEKDKEIIIRDAITANIVAKELLAVAGKRIKKLEAELFILKQQKPLSE